MKKETLIRYTRTVSVLVTFIAAAFFAGSCYSPVDTASGSVSVGATVAARSLLSTGDPTDVIWVAGMVIDSSFEQKMIELQREEDIRKASGSTDISAVENRWLDLATDAAVRFDGGRPFFQFSRPRFDTDLTGMQENGFTIDGIPANKNYFLYLLVLDERLEDAADFAGDPEATSCAHYFDPADAAGGYLFTKTDYEMYSTEVSSNLPAGWYFIRYWGSGFNASGIRSLQMTGEIWTDENGVPIQPKSFIVPPGGASSVTILLDDGIS